MEYISYLWVYSSLVLIIMVMVGWVAEMEQSAVWMVFCSFTLAVGHIVKLPCISMVKERVLCSVWVVMMGKKSL